MSASQLPTRPPDGEEAPRRDLRRAWIAVAAIPVGFVVAFVVGEALITVLGYPDLETEVPPLWLAVLVSLPLIVLAALPAVVAVVYGRRVARSGDNAGYGPLVIGGLVIAYWLVSTVLAVVGRLLE